MFSLYLYMVPFNSNLSYNSSTEYPKWDVFILEKKIIPALLGGSGIKKKTVIDTSEGF